MDLEFVFFFSLGGAVLMPVVNPAIWLPAFIVGRHSPRAWRFWLELLPAGAAAFLIGWNTNGFASMADLDPTVKAVQFVRPALAELFASLVASGLWVLGRRLLASYRSRNIVDAQD